MKESRSRPLGGGEESCKGEPRSAKVTKKVKSREDQIEPLNDIKVRF